MLHLLRGPTVDSDYLILPPAVSPETIADTPPSKAGKQEGKVSNKQMRISFLAIPMSWGGGSFASFSTCLSTFSHSRLSSSTCPLTIPPPTFLPPAPQQPFCNAALAHLHMIRASGKHWRHTLLSLWACNKLITAFWLRLHLLQSLRLTLTHTHGLRLGSTPHTLAAPRQRQRSARVRSHPKQTS